MQSPEHPLSPVADRLRDAVEEVVALLGQAGVTWWVFQVNVAEPNSEVRTTWWSVRNVTDEMRPRPGQPEQAVLGFMDGELGSPPPSRDGSDGSGQDNREAGGRAEARGGAATTADARLRRIQNELRRATTAKAQPKRRRAGRRGSRRRRVMR